MTSFASPCLACSVLSSGFISRFLTRPVTLRPRFWPPCARRRFWAKLNFLSLTPYYKENFAQRDRRTANLSFSGRPLTIKRPKNIPAGNLPAQIALNVVHIWEPAPPEGEEPVEWTLLTSEPISTAEEIRTVVNYYRTRWVIEEFHKALKTGCAYETRQLTTYHSLVVALMIFLPIACRLLFLKSLARTDPDAPASRFLSETELDVLRTFSKRVRLGPKPTIFDVTRAIAGLGGHLKRNGNHGWITLSRGMEKLLSLTEGWEAALQATGRS